MTDKPKASKASGFEISSNKLRIASLSYKNKKYFIDRLLSIAIDPEHSTESNVKPLYTNEEEKFLQHLKKDSLIASALETKNVLVRQTSVQLKKEKDIDAVIEFQAEPLLPYPIDEALIDKIILEKEKESTKLTVIACKAEQISKNLEQWHSIGIEPEVISCVPIAMAAFSEIFHKSQEPFIHINIGETETTGILVYNGILGSAQSIRIGLNDWTEGLMRGTNDSIIEVKQKIEELDFSNLSETEYPELSKQIAQYRLEITRLIYALKKHIPGRQVNSILITGEGSSIKGLVMDICTTLRLNQIIEQNVFDGDCRAEQILEYAVPIGIALTSLPATVNQINFRQKNFTYPNPWKRIKKPFAIYIGVSLCLTLSLYLCGNAYIASQEDELKKSYIDLLSLMRKPFQEYEQEIGSKKLIEDRLSGQKEISAITLTEQDIQYRLQLLEKEIRATPDMFPLYPNIPTVSDVLAWLSTTPVVIGEEKDNSPRIILESLSYKMIKKPELNRKMEKYQVKIEIEFSTPTPRYAREFHDFLLAPNLMIDPQNDVKWNAERGKYRASFFLKDKTQYPNSR